MTEPQDEAEEIVDGVVQDARSSIIEKHENLIEETVENLNNFREMNAVFSEVRRRMEDE